MSRPSLYDGPVIDGHMHVASTRFIPEHFIRDVGASIETKLNGYGERAGSGMVGKLIAQHQDHEADGLVKAMDEARIERAVLLVPDFSLAIPGSMDPLEAMARHHAIRQRHPGRFFLFAGVDPRHGPHAVGWFEQWVRDYAIDGLKLYPPAGYSPSDSLLDPFYEICAAHGLPVLLHTGPTIESLDFSLAMPMLVDRAARRFPRVRFILAHGGVSNVAQCAELCAYRSNVYMDVAGYPAALNGAGWQAHMGQVLRLGIAHKVIYGSDWPTSRLAGGLSNLLDEVRCHPDILSGLNQRERAMFFGGNLLRLLGAD